MTQSSIRKFKTWAPAFAGATANNAVGFVALAMLLPIFEMSASIR